MANLNKITVRDVNIRTIKKDGVDYISLTDIAKQKNTQVSLALVCHADFGLDSSLSTIFTENSRMAAQWEIQH